MLLFHFHVDHHFIKLPLETDNDVEKRYEAFVLCWSKIKEKIEVR